MIGQRTLASLNGNQAPCLVSGCAVRPRTNSYVCGKHLVDESLAGNPRFALEPEAFDVLLQGVLKGDPIATRVLRAVLRNTDTMLTRAQAESLVKHRDVNAVWSLHTEPSDRESGAQAVSVPWLAYADMQAMPDEACDWLRTAFRDVNPDFLMAWPSAARCSDNQQPLRRMMATSESASALGPLVLRNPACPPDVVEDAFPADPEARLDRLDVPSRARQPGGVTWASSKR